MGNEGQYKPLPQQGDVPEHQQQQAYYGWQYEQDLLEQPAMLDPSAPAVPPQALSPVSGMLPTFPVSPLSAVPSQALSPVSGMLPTFPVPPLSAVPPQALSPVSGMLPSMTAPAQTQFRSLRSYGMPSGPLPAPSGPLPAPSGPLPAPSGPLVQPQTGVPPWPAQYQGPSQPQAVARPAQYQEPLLDMGSSLGYGQGMEYQYFNAPQPSQPLPVMPQTRLQQLRSERMRRQQGGQRSLAGTMHSGQAQEQGRKPASPFSPLFHVPAPPPPFVSGAPASQGLSWTPQPSALPETPPMANMSAEYTSTPQSAPGGPVGMLALPSRPLPAVSGRTPGAFAQMAAQQQDSGAGKKTVMTRATMILTGSFIVGRILGLVRTSLFAFVFGTTLTSDAYLQAFLLPDLIFNVVAGGALSSAFIPVFTHYMFGEKDQKTAWHVASSALNLVLALLCLLALVALILAPWLVPLYNPGVPANELSLIITLTRLMLLQSIIMGGGVIINSVLYARQSFLLPAVGTVLYNVGLIVGLLPGFLLTFAGHSDAFTTFAVYAATIGVILGAILQVGVQIPGILKERVYYTRVFAWKHPGVVQIGRQMLPRALNTAMLYASTFVDRILILLLAAGPLITQQSQGLITQYYLALQLMLLPLGIFGMAVSTAAFPTIAENVTLGRLDRVRALIEDTLRSILFLSIPVSVGLIVLGLPIIQVLLQHGAFDLNGATATSVPLAFFAIGLAGLACVEILTRSFYAFRDSKTPVMVSVAQFVLKILLSLLLLQFIRVVQWGPIWGLGSLAFSTSLAGLLEAAVLLYLLQKKIGILELRKMARFAGRVLLASLVMGLLLEMLRFLLDLVLNTTIAPNLGILGSIFAVVKLAFELVVGTLVYIWATRQLGIEDFWKQGPVRRVLQRLKLSWI